MKSFLFATFAVLTLLTMSASALVNTPIDAEAPQSSGETSLKQEFWAGLASARKSFTRVAFHAFATADPVGPATTDGQKPKPEKKCAQPALRACRDICDGEYGNFCFYGTVCNANSHMCEKAGP